MVDIMAADGQAMQGAKASAAKVSTYFFQNIVVSATEGSDKHPT